MGDTERLLKAMRVGELGAREALLHEMQREVREQRIHPWFYDVGHAARHADIAALRATLDLAREPAVVRRVLTSLAYTLSLEAAGAILEYQVQSDAEEDDGYALQLAALVIRVDGMDEWSIRDRDVHAEYVRATSGLDPTLYYVRGSPVLAGDLADELVARAQASVRDGATFLGGYEATLLSAMSRLPCPVQWGGTVDRSRFEAVISYARTIQTLRWAPGTKRYFGHEVR